MALPLRIQHRGPKGAIIVELTAAGLGVRGQAEPRVDLLIHLWDALVTALALDEVDLKPVAGYGGHCRRVAEARAALQARLAGKKSRSTA